tara:strand:- start:4801 stop:5454 length:654 start_codon:yes stop_codon:yes gene_type:complete
MTEKRAYGSYDYVFRIVLVGDSNVGKTALTRRFADKRFIEHYDATIGIDYGSTIIEIPNSIYIKCQIWDTAGQETFAPLIASYYKDTAGFVMVFDVSDRESFDRIKYWLTEIEENKNHNIEVPKILVGNKIDKYKRTVTKVEAINFAYKHNLLYQETSVRHNKNVDNILLMLCKKIHTRMDSLPGVKYGSNRIKLDDGVQNNIDVDPDEFSCNCNIS